MAVMGTREYQSYKQTEIETASPGKLLLLLYDGAIKRLRRAQEAFEREALEEVHQDLVKVQQILIELMLALDWKVGGDLAPRLHALYDFMYRRLVDANVKRSNEPIAEVLQLLSTLREGWAEAYRQLSASGELPNAGTPTSKINVEG